jgi:hypothetical protein
MSLKVKNWQISFLATLLVITSTLPFFSEITPERTLASIALFGLAPQYAIILKDLASAPAVVHSMVTMILCLVILGFYEQTAWYFIVTYLSMGTGALVLVYGYPNDLCK